MPVTIPVPEPIVAIVALLLVHVPPVVASESDMFVPAQRGVLPVIGVETELTVTTVVAKHPEAIV